MKIKVKVDPQLCIGAASCIVVAPEHFELNTEGKAEVKKSEQDHMLGYEMDIDVDEAGMEKMIDAARSCPTQAILVFDESGKQLFP